MKLIRVIKASNDWYKEYYKGDYLVEDSFFSLPSEVKDHFKLLKPLGARSKYFSLLNDYNLSEAFIVKNSSGNIIIATIKGNKLVELEENKVKSLVDKKMKDYEWKKVRITTESAFKKFLESGIGKELYISSSRGGGDYAQITTNSDDQVIYYIGYNLAIDMVEKFNLKLIDSSPEQEGRNWTYSLHR